MARTHHCLADGMALVAVLLAMTDFYPDAPLTPGEPIAGLSGDGLLGGWRREVGHTVGLARALAGRAVGGARAVVSDAEHALGLGEMGAGYGLAAGRLLARSPDPRTRLKGKLGVMKRAAWSAPFPLDDIKLIKNALGGTVNDVIVTAVAGGLRRYLVAKGDEVGNDRGGLEIRAALPVNLRDDADNGKLGNKFGLVFLTLPIYIEEPLMRLAEVRRRMLELKRSAEAPVTLGILGAMGLGTDAFREFVVRTLEPKATVVLTNVPGPPIPLYLAGQPIDSLMFWVPQSGRLGLGISILSYAGHVTVGVATDAGLVPEPDEIVLGFYGEYDELLGLA
jgi:WS/DGAT/MGAT family acyltransferase